MEYVAIASSVMSAIGSIQQGQQQAAMYELQAKQADLKARRDALQYEQQANLVREKMLMTNANAAAKGFAGGIQGFSGSAKLVQERNEKVAGRDIQIMQEGAKSALSFGEIQSAMLQDAASQAVTGSYFDAFAKLGTAAYMYNQVSVGSVTPTPAPIEEMSTQANFYDMERLRA